MKPINFDLLLNSTRIATLAQLEENLTPEILEPFRSGNLAKWLRGHKLNEQAEAVERLFVEDNADELQLLKSLYALFGGESDEDLLQAAIMKYKNESSCSQEKMATARSHPFPAPLWASECHEDAFGYYADLTVKNIVQRFRWIEAGTFLMSSPNDEIDHDNETQHQVTLTRGYWLADTACTQALWQAVMGDNPADFNEDMNNPVERVTWDDVKVFIDNLNQFIPNLNACLPSEAQWEYACRAGTTTPFSFGNNITPEQVNYDGNYPYADEQEGLYREKTVPVKSLLPNAWGLYEMHGNVWEWCSDWYGDYPPVAVTNPRGALNGTSRVVRGGSWSGSARYTRSVYRLSCVSDFCYNFIGFRLALA